MHAYRQLKVWHLAQDIGELLTRAFTHSAQYRTPGLRTQLVRAGLSISANIAEGSSRRSQTEFRRYLEISLGSLLEVENGLALGMRCNVIPRNQYMALKSKCNVLRRMIGGLIQRLANDNDANAIKTQQR